MSFCSDNIDVPFLPVFTSQNNVEYFISAFSVLTTESSFIAILKSIVTNFLYIRRCRSINITLETMVET